jgi:hypothetical protein
VISLDAEEAKENGITATPPQVVAMDGFGKPPGGAHAAFGHPVDVSPDDYDPGLAIKPVSRPLDALKSRFSAPSTPPKRTVANHEKDAVFAWAGIGYASIKAIDEGKTDAQLAGAPLHLNAIKIDKYRNYHATLTAMLDSGTPLLASVHRGIRQLPAETFERILSSDILSWDSMVSTTTKLDQAIGFAGGSKPVEGDLGIIFTIHAAPKAVSLKGGRNAPEDEVILPRGNYRVLKVTRLNPQQAHVEVEAL